ncbi:MAG: MarR family transcriptional regulator [Acidobacteriaceae bacterium]
MERSQSSEHVQTIISPAETALASIERTANHLRREIHLMLRAYGLTWTQYNVLRVLRDDRAGGLSCSELGSRLAAADPDITRLLDRLTKPRLVRRRRDVRDRRSVVTEITPEGRQLLASIGLSLDGQIRGLFDHIAPARLQLLVELLEETRNSQKPNERAAQPLPQTRTG